MLSITQLQSLLISLDTSFQTLDSLGNEDTETNQFFAQLDTHQEAITELKNKRFRAILAKNQQLEPKIKTKTDYLNDLKIAIEKLEKESAKHGIRDSNTRFFYVITVFFFVCHTKHTQDTLLYVIPFDNF